MLALALLVANALAADAPVKVALHGDVKSFFVASQPYQWFALSADTAPALAALGISEADALDAFGLSAKTSAQGIANGRLKLTISRGDSLRLDVHWAIAAQNTAPTAIALGAESGVVQSAPEIVRLTWRPDLGDGVPVQHRVDRLVLSAKLPSVDVSVGRQPISFGSGRVFTPLDLVNPFSPATIDAEYKPGVDAVRVDGYAGTAGKVSIAAAYAGDQPLIGANRRTTGPIVDDLVLAAMGQGTVGVTDVAGFFGVVHGDPVVGTSIVSAIGPVGLHGDATLTIPGGGDPPFVRAVVGADGRPTGKTTVMGEAYVQSFGASSPDHYLDALSDPRFLRGEVWQLGQVYAALSVAQEITPLVAANVSVIGNLRDPSALIVAGGSWSVADNAVVAFGAYLGAGKRPDTVDVGLAIDLATGAPMVVPPTTEALAASVNSEFGLYPAVVYLQVRTYF